MYPPSLPPSLSPPHPPEEHAKAHSLTDASGISLRFCQQCSRLQPLNCFEGSRRSCASSLTKRECVMHGGCVGVGWGGRVECWALWLVADWETAAAAVHLHLPDTAPTPLA